MHFGLPTIGAYVPAAQLKHSEERLLELCPIGQNLHEGFPRYGPYVPASQSMHKEEPFIE